MQLADRVVVVTGAARGIGRAIAEELASAGAVPALIDVEEGALAATLEACRARGVRAGAYAANVADEPAVVETIARIAQDFGRLDGLVNNAGIIRDALLIKATGAAIESTMTLAQWQAVIDVNLTGVFLCGREAASWMVKYGAGGVIVNISSISRHGNAGQSNYSAAKAGVAALAVVWAKELARHGIRCAAIAPGAVRTEILAAMRPDMLEKLTAPIPLKRMGESREVASAVRFIFENDYFTGRCIDLDGGLRV